MKLIALILASLLFAGSATADTAQPQAKYYREVSVWLHELAIGIGEGRDRRLADDIAERAQLVGAIADHIDSGVEAADEIEPVLAYYRASRAVYRTLLETTSPDCPYASFLEKMIQAARDLDFFGQVLMQKIEQRPYLRTILSESVRRSSFDLRNPDAVTTILGLIEMELEQIEAQQ